MEFLGTMESKHMECQLRFAKYWTLRPDYASIDAYRVYKRLLRELSLKRQTYPQQLSKVQ
jgi:hypothetical protein